MHLYALDQQGQSQYARGAEKQRDYFCLECNGIVRVREGLYRQPHFYHLQNSASCRQSGKSLIHLQVQLFIEKLLPFGEVSLEYRFPSIQRIADLVWHPERLVFEVQCSPMRRDEMEARVKDYRSLGYQLVWILHDRRYNKWRLSAMEAALAFTPHYFTNINADGTGYIYDQWQWIAEGRRLSALPALTVDLSTPYRRLPHPPRNWPLGFQGDLLSLEANHPYLIKVSEKEKELRQQKKKSFKVWISRFSSLLKALFEHLLKKYCRD